MVKRSKINNNNRELHHQMMILKEGIKRLRIDKEAKDGKEDEEMIDSEHPTGSIDLEMLMLRKMTKRLRIDEDAKEDDRDEKEDAKEGNRDEKEMINRELPTDLLVDILARVDMKSLYKLQCVCKLWKELISDSYFHKLYGEKFPS